MNSSQRPDYLVIGAGIIGLLTALSLARAGHKVLVLEQDGSHRSASRAGGGLLMPLTPWQHPPIMRSLFKQSLSLYPELIEYVAEHSLFPATRLMQKISLLFLSHADQSEHNISWARDYGFLPSTLDRETLHEKQSGLSDHYDHALCLPDVYTINNPRLLRALRQCLSSLGVIIRTGTVRQWQRQGDRLQAAVTDEGSYEAGDYIIAAGAGSGPLCHALGLPDCVRPVRGQMLAVRPASPNPLRHVVIEQDYYLIPRDQLILIGSTVEESGFDNRVTEAARQELTQAALRIFPGLDQLPFRVQWAGLRPAGLRAMPYIGSVTGIRNLSINSGHFRNGLLLAPISAQLLTAHLLNGATIPTELLP